MCNARKEAMLHILIKIFVRSFSIKQAEYLDRHIAEVIPQMDITYSNQMRNVKGGIS